MLPNLPHLFLL